MHYIQTHAHIYTELNNVGVRGNDPPRSWKSMYNFIIIPVSHLWIQPTTDHVVLQYVFTRKIKLHIHRLK